MGNRKGKALEKKLAALLASRVSNEMSYISGISALVGKNERQRLELLLKSRRSPTYAEGDSTLSLRPPMEAGTDQVKQDSKHVFVLSFPGDVTASQVSRCGCNCRWNDNARGDASVASSVSRSFVFQGWSRSVGGGYFCCVPLRSRC